MPPAVISLIAVNAPADVIDAIVVAPYLNNNLPPDSTIENPAVTSVVAAAAVVAFVASVAVAALPPILKPAAVPVMFVPTKADGVPRAGVTNVGLVANTTAPVPVSSVKAAAKLALEGVARNAATLVPKPLTPVLIGRPVQFVSVPEVGVPKSGVTNVGLVANTAEPVPVSFVSAVSNCNEVNEPKDVALPTEVTAPVKLALVVTVAALPPILKPAAVPVMFVPTNADGVPSAGVTKVGLVAKTTAPVPVTVANSLYSGSQSAAVVRVVPIHIHWTVTPGITVMTRFPPDELTVKLPVEAFSIA